MESVTLSKNEPLVDRIDYAKEVYEFSEDIRNALHQMRMKSNDTAHNTEPIPLITAAA